MHGRRLWTVPGVKPRPAMVTSSPSALMSSPPARERVQGAGLLERVQLLQGVVNLRERLDRAVGFGRHTGSHHREPPLEPLPHEAQAGADAVEPVVHRPTCSRKAPPAVSPHDVVPLPPALHSPEREERAPLAPGPGEQEGRGRGPGGPGPAKGQQGSYRPALLRRGGPANM